MRLILVTIFLIVFHHSASAAEPLTADSLALRLLDGEGLYTATGGIKPISDGFWHCRFPAAEATSPEVDHARQLLAGLPLGNDFAAGVYVFSTPFQGKRSASAYIAHMPSLKALVERRKDAFDPIGVTIATPAQTVMEKIDRAPRSARWRAFGLVFGYPDYAVEFFVASGEHQDESGQFVERDFLHLPTFTSSDGRFVYAVPKGHAERDEDRKLKAVTAPIFARYKTWREVYVGEGKAGGVSLLRDWLAPPVVIAEPTIVYMPPNVPCVCPTAATVRMHRFTIRHR